MINRDQDYQYMKRALFLAEQGIGKVSPNPFVGCVIVKDERIIGEGYHKKYGDNHAEVNAVNSVTDKSLLQGATVYVTLEPCSHTGKTPPCTNILINSRIKKVIIAQKDINLLVNGKGITLLKNAGIEVHVGVCEDEAKHLNRRFNTFHTQKRPYVLLKWAQTKDRFMTRHDFEAGTEKQWISSPSSRMLSHRWRAEETAILVGKKTVETDNPRLNARLWSSQQSPVRIVIDPSFSLDYHYHIFDGKQQTYHIGYDSNISDKKINKPYHGVHIQPLPEDNFLNCFLDFLFQKQIQSVLIEGGSYTLKQFIRHGLWDEMRVFTSNIITGGVCQAPQIPAFNSVETNKVETDELKVYLK